MLSRLVRFTYPCKALHKHSRSGLHSSGRLCVLAFFSKAKAVQRVTDIATSSYFSYNTAVTTDVEHDTIAALSSGSGRCGVALLRVSGPLADDVLQSLLPPRRALPLARQALVSNIHHPSTKELLDRALLLRFPAPRSFTGEDVAELHVHGGPAVVRAVLDALCSIQGVRLAEPGEFTRRAFELGKVDLTEAEGLADLLSSETEAQRKQALKQSTGLQRQQYESWRRTLLQCLANVEAVIDFGEDEGIAEEVAEQVLPRVQRLGQQLRQHLVSDRRGELVRSGVRAAIVGPPNVGKSSILNYLAGRKAAIVSEIPGTTRDAIDVILDIAGYKVIVTDTAGMRETLDPVEAEGVAVAHQTAQQADLVLCQVTSKPLDRHSAALVGEKHHQLMGNHHRQHHNHLALEKGVRNIMESGEDSQEGLVITRARHRQHVQECTDALQRYEEVHLQLELAAEELRGAARALGRVTGVIDTEDLLDAIFTEFCIGK
ncbi:hypothetical protein WJX82_011176 [Trebouxia sp. C0006]